MKQSGFRRATHPAIAAPLALIALATVDVALAWGGYPAVRRLTGRVPCSDAGCSDNCERLVSIFETVKSCYFKRVRCLQAAAAAVCFLRLHGIAARLVIGVRPRPFASHAWVEVDGCSMVTQVDPKSYAVIERV